MKARVFVLIAAIALTATAAARADEFCYLPYEQFEDLIPHFDIETCPDPKFPSDQGFCRLGLDGTIVLVYHFRLGENADCLAAIDTYSFRDFHRRFGSTYKME